MASCRNACWRWLQWPLVEPSAPSRSRLVPVCSARGRHWDIAVPPRTDRGGPVYREMVFLASRNLHLNLGTRAAQWVPASLCARAVGASAVSFADYSDLRVDFRLQGGQIASKALLLPPQGRKSSPRSEKSAEAGKVRRGRTDPGGGQAQGRTNRQGGKLSHRTWSQVFRQQNGRHLASARQRPLRLWPRQPRLVLAPGFAPALYLVWYVPVPPVLR